MQGLRVLPNEEPKGSARAAAAIYGSCTRRSTLSRFRRLIAAQSWSKLGPVHEFNIPQRRFLRYTGLCNRYCTRRPLVSALCQSDAKDNLLLDFDSAIRRFESSRPSQRM